MFEDEISKTNEGMSISLNTYEKRTYTVEEIQNILSIGRNAAYSLVKSNVFHSVRIGGNIRISRRSFDTWLDDISDKQMEVQADE